VPRHWRNAVVLPTFVLSRLYPRLLSGAALNEARAIDDRYF
jgi:hypothetical protein